MMTLEEYERLKEIDITGAMDDLKKATVKSNFDVDLTVMYAAYMMVMVKEHPEVTGTKFGDYEILGPSYGLGVSVLCDAYILLAEPCDPREIQYKNYRAHELYEGEIWDNVYALKDKYDADTFKACVLFGDRYLGFDRIPDSMALLVNELVEVQEGSVIANHDKGAGSFLAKFRLLNPSTRATVTTLDYRYAAPISQKQDILGLIKPGEDYIDEFWSLENYDEGYDLFFAKISDDMSEHILPRQKEILNQSSFPAPWACIDGYMKYMNEGGKMVVVVNRSNLQTQKHENARRYYVENGLVETVINLPLKLFDDAWKQTSLLVLSRGNKEVSFINAEDICSEGRLKGARIKFFKDSDAKDIAALVRKNTDKSVVVSNEELLKDTCVWDVRRYLNKNEDENGRPLVELAVSIKRAASIGSKEFDRMKSEELTEYKCLMPGDIHDGVFEVENLPNIKDDDARYKNFSLEPGDVLLTKNGKPYKVAVFDSNKQVIANGNLYIIRVDRNMVDPYYLKAFLQSEKGLKCIISHQTESNMPMISKVELERMEIPLPNK
ncbi:MAG: N-6 DNA methylase, partial [Pseudobutyrivibrio sp.]|nr:N-6 DNA methylase [Pseudobutyrivibrio sp.]